MKLARLTTLALLLASAPALAEKTEHSPPDTAFLFEARLGVGSSFTFGGGGNLSGSFSAVPSFLVGARLIGRLHLGLGFAFFRISTVTGNGPGVPATSSDINQVTFAPTAAFDLIRSRDERVAFYLKAGLPLGPLITCATGAPCDTGFTVGFDFALGARYALHRMFSLGLEAGATGMWFNPQRASYAGITSFYGALVGSFMSGH